MRMEHQAVVDACTHCAIECESCFEHDMSDEDRLSCARANMDCARACWETASALARSSPFSFQYCGHCAAICDGCAEVATQFDTEECRKCVEVCKACAAKCREFAHAEVGV